MPPATKGRSALRSNSTIKAGPTMTDVLRLPNAQSQTCATHSGSPGRNRFVTDKLTHFDESGRAHMVDVGGKEITSRRAVATGFVRMHSETVTLIREGRAA